MRTGAVTLTIDSCLDHVFLIGLAINKICAAIPLGEEDAYHTELCVVEAVNNAIEHAYRAEAGHSVEIAVRLGCGRLLIEVRDSGESMNGEGVRWSTGTGNALAEGGRGLFIMQSLMDDVSYTRVDGKNVITLVKDVRRAQESQGLA